MVAENATPMSFFNLRPVEYESGIGPFNCPRCYANAQFLRIRLAKSLSIGGVPVLAFKTLSEYVRCSDCHSDMKARELLLAVGELAKLDTPWKCRECGATSEPTVDRCVDCAAPRLIKRLAAPDDSPAAPVEQEHAPAAVPSSGRGI